MRRENIIHQNPEKHTKFTIDVCKSTGYWVRVYLLLLATDNYYRFRYV